MAVVISDIGGETSNSYGSLEQANAYFSERLFSDVFVNADEQTQSKSLIMATNLLEALVKWHGTKTTTTQRLSFPRAGLKNKDGEEILDSEIPSEILAAEFELALVLISQDRVKDTSTVGISAIAVGPIRLDLDKNKKKNVFPDIVYELISWFGITEQRDLSNRPKFVPLMRV